MTDAVRLNGDGDGVDCDPITVQKIGIALEVMNDLDVMHIHPDCDEDYYMEAGIVGAWAPSGWSELRLANFLGFVIDASFDMDGSWEAYKELAGALKAKWPDDGIDPGNMDWNPMDKAAEDLAEYAAIVDNLWLTYPEILNDEGIGPFGLSETLKPCKHIAATCCRISTRGSRRPILPGFEGVFEPFDPCNIEWLMESGGASWHDATSEQ